MNDRRRRLLLCVAALPVLQWPRTGVAQSGRVPTVTRLVKIFMDREGELLAAMRAHDAARLAPMLSDRFEMRVGHEPGTPVPRADWIAQVSEGAAGEYRIEQMAVQDAAPLAIASFMLRPLPAAKRAAPLFIVDAWEPDGDSWRLRVRYATVLAATRARVPGDAAPPKIEKKY